MVSVSDKVRLVVEGVECWATVRRSRLARRPKVRALRNQLEVVLPWRAPLRAADQLLAANRGWVLRHMLRIAKEMRDFDPASTYYRGDEWRIEVVETGPLFAKDVETKTFRVKAQGVSAARALVGRRLRAEAKASLIPLVREWETRMAVKVSTLTVRDQKSKWGSCSQKGGVNFNWRLVLAPPEVMQAIVVHELAHLVHLNHSRDFWTLVAHHDPEHRKHEKWLKDHQHRLMEPFELV